MRLPKNVGGIYLEKLIAALAIDLFGNSPYLAPIVGNAIIAPISGVAIWMLFGVEIPALIGVLEELTPVTAWIPTATLTYIYSTFIDK